MAPADACTHNGHHRPCVLGLGHLRTGHGQEGSLDLLMCTGTSSVTYLWSWEGEAALVLERTLSGTSTSSLWTNTAVQWPSTTRTLTALDLRPMSFPSFPAVLSSPREQRYGYRLCTIRQENTMYLCPLKTLAGCEASWPRNEVPWRNLARNQNRFKHISPQRFGH
jgi:hypothetical protein